MQRTRYNGPPLQPGEFYEGVIYHSANFRTIDSPQRRPIVRQLQAIDRTQFKQRSQIYQQAPLRSDGFTELFRTVAPEPALRRALEQMQQRKYTLSAQN